MIGLDTNVLVRLATRDDEKQAEMAQRLITKADEPVFVHSATILEFVWVLESAYDEYTREMIADAVVALLGLGSITVDSAPAIRRAVRLYVTGTDFADALFSEANVDAGCRTTMTFDRNAAPRLPRMSAVC